MNDKLMNLTERYSDKASRPNTPINVIIGALNGVDLYHDCVKDSIFYHQRNDDMQNIIQMLLADSDSVLEICKTDFEEEMILITDGGYDGQDNIVLAKEKNVKLVTTALIGKEAPDASSDFEFNEDGTRLQNCAT